MVIKSSGKLYDIEMFESERSHNICLEKARQ